MWDVGSFFSTVHESIADQFVSVLRRDLTNANVQAGHAEDDAHKLKGLFSPASAKRVQGLISDAVSKGAKVVIGEPGSLASFDGSNLVQPFVVDHVTSDMS